MGKKPGIDSFEININRKDAKAQSNTTEPLPLCSLKNNYIVP